jgi:hypothetical protein
MVFYRPGERSRLIYRLHHYRCRKGLHPERVQEHAASCAPAVAWRQHRAGLNQLGLPPLGHGAALVDLAPDPAARLNQQPGHCRVQTLPVLACQADKRYVSPSERICMLFRRHKECKGCNLGKCRRLHRALEVPNHWTS